MGGSSPSVFHTTPPQPALKARTTLYSLSVGGAEASQNGFGDLMPARLERRSAMISVLLGSRRLSAPQVAVDRVRGDLAVLHTAHRKIEAGHAIAAGIDAGQRGLPVLVHGDAPA